MSAPAKYPDRVLELLVQRATDSLNASEQIELNRLLAQDKQPDGHQFEQTAAALLLAGVGEEEPMPEGLKAKLMGQAENFALNMATRSPVVNMPFAEKTKSRHRVSARAKAMPANRWPWVATAAALLIALAGWWPRLMDGTEGSQFTDVLTNESTVKREWQRTEDPAAAGVTGEVIWNQATQVGYMRFRGLAANDPQRVQYQLWIFDRSRGDKYPVDGGVFDIAADQGEVLVPITARLPVRDPAMFAVTLEQAGGSVVSEREHIVVLAKVAG
jgi:anti-sigma-K factor RskA